MTHFPRITVVTPSYNQGQFLEQTILSVLGQNYPNLEYIIMDGGSSDQSVEIIKAYEHQLSFWTSQKDKGQSDAINSGFAQSTGDILCWLNSDDYLLPGTLTIVGQKLQHEKPQILYGNCLHINESTHSSYASDVLRSFRNHPLEMYDPIIQPSSFWTRSVWEKVGQLDDSKHFIFDWEWFLRCKKMGVEFVGIENYLSVYRIHPSHKSANGGQKRIEEIHTILSENNPAHIPQAFLYLFEKRKEIVQLKRYAQKLRIPFLTILHWRHPALKPLDEKSFYLLFTLLG
ncbi:MAG: glycosyltransferase [Cytophagales bacterium]|nr:glycosyltransferase [Cytophagales bacterium]